MRETESDRLRVQIQAYLDNMFHVSTLLEDSEMKLTAMERVEELEEQLLDVSRQLRPHWLVNLWTKMIDF